MKDPTGAIPLKQFCAEEGIKHGRCTAAIFYRIQNGGYPGIKIVTRGARSKFVEPPFPEFKDQRIERHK